jgi:fermentation-respiration switch protein FrsA (DUF1100 family)
VPRSTIAIIALVAIVLFLVFARPAVRILFRAFERRQLYFPIRAIDATPGQIGLPYEDIYFLTSDGLKLNGWFIPADDPLATVLFCHGNGGNIGHRLEMIEFLYRLGFNTFIFDYRGYGQSEGSPNEEGTYRDALAAFNYVCGRQEVDARKTVIYGRSLGGAIAIDLATRVECAGLISESCPTSIVEMGRKLYPFLPVARLASNRYEAINKIGQADMPVLIIHSRNDEMIPYAHGQRLFDVAAPPKEFITTYGYHNDSPATAGEEYHTKLPKFIARCVGESG